MLIFSIVKEKTSHEHRRIIKKVTYSLLRIGLRHFHPFGVLNTIFPIKLPVDNLPVTDIAATFTPMVAASILMYREEGFESVKNLLKRAFDCKRITKKVWYIPIIFLTPFIFVLTYMIMRLVGLPVPTVWSPPLRTPLLFIAFFFAAAGEELGYTGYVTDPMQARYKALTASLIIGSRRRFQ